MSLLTNHPLIRATDKKSTLTIANLLDPLRIVVPLEDLQEFASIQNNFTSYYSIDLKVKTLCIMNLS